MLAEGSTPARRNLLAKCSKLRCFVAAGCEIRQVYDHGRGSRDYNTGSRVVDFLVRNTKLVLTERTAASCNTWVDRKCSYASMLAATIRSR